MTHAADQRYDLRPANGDDAAWMADLERRAGSGRWNESAFVGELKRAHGRTRVACAAQQQPVGFILYWLVGDEAELINIAVEPGWQRRGVATLLVKAMLVEARAAGCRQVHLEVREGNGAARSFYAAFGFEIAGRRAAYYGDTGEDGLRMVLELPSPNADHLGRKSLE